MLLSIVLIVGLELLELFVKRTAFPYLNNGPPWLAGLSDTLRNIFNRQRDSADEFLGTVAGIGGVFLGLYFAAVSVVAGSMFPNAPGIIREQLVRERVGNLYVNILALLTMICIILLGYQSIGPGPGIVTLSFVLLLSIFGVLSFAQLGKRVFTLLDLSELARPAIADLYADIRNATIRGFAWADEAFQNHFKERASAGIALLEAFIKNGVKSSEKEEEPLIKLVRSAFYLLSSYVSDKRLIPTDSKWYETKFVHQNWFLADSTALSLALNTNVGIQPKTQPNQHWFEDRIINAADTAISSLIAAKQVNAAYRALNPISGVLKTCGRELALEEAKKLIELTNVKILSHAHTCQKAPNEAALGDYDIGLIDLHGYCILDFVLGFFQALERHNHTQMRRTLSRISWRRPKSLYKHELPLSMLKRMEFVQKTISFETLVEGSPISPQWYRDQLIVMSYVELVASGLQLLVELLRSEFVKVSRTYQENKQVLFSTMHALRGLEVCTKIDFHVEAIKERIDSFAESHVLSDLQWPGCDWDKLRSDINTNREDLIEILAKSLPNLSLVDRRTNSPDLFGQSYNTVYSHIISLLEQNRAPEFGRMFPSYFFSALKSYDILRKDESLTQADVKTQIIFGTEPLMDLLDLSGYARIYSELFLSTDLWEKCKRTWDNYLDALPKDSTFVSLLVSAVEFRRAQFSLIPRDILRTNWQINLRRILADFNLIDVMGQRGYYGRRDPPLEHCSPFIRAFCRGRFEPMVSAVEVFVITYLSGRPEDKGSGFKDSDRFMEKIREESAQQQTTQTRASDNIKEAE